MLTTADFLARYPLFDSIPESIIDSEITLQTDLFNTSLSKSLVTLEETIADRAVALLVAHTLYLEYSSQLQLSSALRSVENASSIDLNFKDSEEYYKLTIYGRQFLELKRIYNVTYRNFNMFVI